MNFNIDKIKSILIVCLFFLFLFYYDRHERPSIQEEKDFYRIKEESFHGVIISISYVQKGYYDYVRVKEEDGRIIYINYLSDFFDRDVLEVNDIINKENGQLFIEHYRNGKYKKQNFRNKIFDNTELTYD